MLDEIKNNYNLFIMFIILIGGFLGGYMVSNIRNQSSLNEYDETITELRANARAHYCIQTNRTWGFMDY
jgi:hypothetical protein